MCGEIVPRSMASAMARGAVHEVAMTSETFRPIAIVGRDPVTGAARRHTVAAIIIGGYGVHPDISLDDALLGRPALWRVTHLRSGYSCGGRMQEQQARAVARALDHAKLIPDDAPRRSRAEPWWPQAMALIRSTIVIARR